MMKEEVLLSDVATVRSGYPFKSSQWTESGVPVVKIANVKDGTIDLTSTSFVSPAVAAQASDFRLCQGDIVIAMTGYVGEVARVSTNDELLLNQRVGRFEVVDELRLDSEYLFQFLRTSEARAEITSRAYGSAQPNISPRQILSLRIPLPTIGEQRAIAEVLRALDDKIATNTSLVRTSSEVRREQYQRAIAIEPSRLKLKDIAVHLPGRYLAKSEYGATGSFPVYGSNSLMGWHTVALYDGPICVLARIGSSCGNRRWSEGAAWVNNNASAIRALPTTNPWILREALDLVDMNPFRAGSGQPFIQIDALMNSEVITPRFESSSEVGELLSKLSGLEARTAIETRTLGELHDTLLPQLMSGKLRVKDAEKQVEAVV